MLDNSNHNVRQVKTPIGIGTLNGYDEDTKKYQVQVSRKNATVEIQSPCVFRFFTAEELDEITNIR